VSRVHGDDVFAPTGSCLTAQSVVNDLAQAEGVEKCNGRQSGGPLCATARVVVDLSGVAITEGLRQSCLRCSRISRGDRGSSLPQNASHASLGLDRVVESELLAKHRG
jgi:hypothetical protein